MSTNGVALDYSQMTIEHIAPQSGASTLAGGKWLAKTAIQKVWKI
jgi:hypothetical protein